MKTYPAEVVRRALLSLIERDKPVRFTVYSHNSRPIKVKAKITCVWCSPEGISISFHNAYINRAGPIGRIKVLAKDIRWITNPFNQQKFEERCQQYVLKLTEGRQGE